MSLPQTERGAPPGEHARVIVSPSAPFSEVALVSQAKGFAGPLAEGGAEAGAELLAVSEWGPPPVLELLLAFFSVEQAPVAITSTRMIAGQRRQLSERNAGRKIRVRQN